MGIQNSYPKTLGVILLAGFGGAESQASLQSTVGLMEGRDFHQRISGTESIIEPKSAKTEATLTKMDAKLAAISESTSSIDLSPSQEEISKTPNLMKHIDHCL